MTASAREQIPIGTIVAELAGRAEALCRELLPGGRRDGAEWVVESAHSPLGCSMAVHLAGARAGVWGAWAAGEHGDALKLVLVCADLQRYRRDGDKGPNSAALRWAREWLGYGAAGGEPGKAASAPAGHLPRNRGGGSGDDEAAEIERRRNAAVAIWLHAEPSLKGTAAERYLLGRGIDLGQLGRQPRALRFHPNLWNERTQRFWPALVAIISRPNAVGKSEPVAVHRIWLTPEGKKAPILDAAGENKCKQAYGPYRGGAIALCRGFGETGKPGKPLGQAPAGSAMWLTEGIEDGLAIALLTGGAERVLAAVSLQNMSAVILPPAITEVVIAAQNDPCWHPGQDRPHPTVSGLDKAIRRFQAEGRTVRLWRVPDEASRAGCKDADDYVQWLKQREELAA